MRKIKDYSKWLGRPWDEILKGKLDPSSGGLKNQGTDFRKKGKKKKNHYPSEWGNYDGL